MIWTHRPGTRLDNINQCPVHLVLDMTGQDLGAQTSSTGLGGFVGLFNELSIMWHVVNKQVACLWGRVCPTLYEVQYLGCSFDHVGIQISLGRALRGRYLGEVQEGKF